MSKRPKGKTCKDMCSQHQRALLKQAVEVIEKFVQFIQKESQTENVVLISVNLLIPVLPNQPKKGAECPLSQGEGLPERKVMFGGGKGAVEPCQRKKGEPLV